MRASTRRAVSALALAAALPHAGCEVEWGGASFELVNPAPPSSPAAPRREAVSPPAALPEGPLLHVARLAPDGTTALLLPVARLGAAGVDSLALPESVDADYRARFDSLFLAPGRELALYAGGVRVGSLALEAERIALGDGCPSAARAAVLLPPGSAAPLVGLAIPLQGRPASPRPFPGTEPDGRLRTWAPILAERVLRESGETRPWLAQLAALSAIGLADEEEPVLAATYLIGDSLGVAEPRGEAVSLFFLARPEGPGYEPEWYILRRYDSAAEREVYVYLDRIALAGRSVDFLVRRGAGPPLLVASGSAEDGRRIEWVESARCPSLELLAEAAAG